MKKNGFLESGQAVANGSESKVTGDKRPSVHEPLFDFGGRTVKDLKLRDAVTVSSTTTCADAAKLMQEHQFDQVPVVLKSSDKKGPVETLVGLVTLGNILSKIAHGRAALTDPVSKIMFRFDKSKRFKEVTVDTPLAELSKFFDTNSAAVVTTRVKDAMAAKHVITKIDLVGFMVMQSGSAPTARPPSPKKKKTQQ